MRTAVLALLALGVVLFAAHAAWASEARRHLDEANAALAVEPPKRDVAQGALMAAIAAADEPQAVAEADFMLGRLDEEDAAYPQALIDYRACMEAAPGTRWMMRASDRIDWLRARSEGNFGPLTRLEHLRHDEAMSSDPAAIEALARDADGFPPGMVRVESRMLVAEAWLGRMHRPDDAIAELRKVTQEPKADALTLRLAERELIDALVAQDRIDEAIAEAASHSNRLDPKFVKQVKRLRVRRAVRYGSAATLGAFGILALVAMIRASRRQALDDAWAALRRLAPIALVFVAFIAVAGGTLASKYESGNATPFYAFGITVLPLVLLARAWGSIGSPSRAARAARAVLCGGAIASAAFMLLESLNPAYLEGFGL